MIPFYEELNKQLANYDDIKQKYSNEDLVNIYREDSELYWSASDYLRKPHTRNNSIHKADYLIPSMVVSYSCEISLKSILTLKTKS